MPQDLTHVPLIPFDRRNVFGRVLTHITALHVKREAILQGLGNASLGDCYAFSRQGRDVDQTPFQGNTACLQLGDLYKAREKILQVQTRLLDELEKLIMLLR